MPYAALVLAPLTCSVVLLVSGIAKLGHDMDTRGEMAALRVPQALRSDVVVKGHPWVEIALGVLMLVTWSWALAVVAALVTTLFAAYWILVIRVLRRGEEVDCGCFGALGDDRITATTVGRNSVLVLLAALTVAFGVAGSGVLAAMRDFDAADWWWLMLAALGALTAVLVVGLHGKDPTVDVADVDLLDYERVRIPFALLENDAGDRVSLRELASERAQLLILLSSGCPSCDAVANQIPTWAELLSPVEISTVFTDPMAEVRTELRAPGARAWFDVANGATDTFARQGRPAAVLLGADGMLAGGPVAGEHAVSDFVGEIAEELTATADDHGETDHNPGARDIPGDAPGERPPLIANEHSHTHSHD